MNTKPMQFLELHWTRETDNPNSYFSYKYRIERAENNDWIIFKYVGNGSYCMVSSFYSLHGAIKFLEKMMI
jgi:hypothetical protein